MDKSRQIVQTAENMITIYQQVSELLLMIEETIAKEKFDGKSLEVQKSKKCTWDGSAAMNVPEKWMQRFFVRYYTEKTRNKTKRAIGIGVWIYGSLGAEMISEKPYISCSVIEYNPQFESNLWEWVRKAGKNEKYAFEASEQKPLLYESVFQGDTEENEKEFERMRVFFTDLVSVTDQGKINELILEPLKAIYEDKTTNLTFEHNYLTVS